MPKTFKFCQSGEISSNLFTLTVTNKSTTVTDNSSTVILAAECPTSRIEARGRWWRLRRWRKTIPVIKQFFFVALDHETVKVTRNCFVTVTRCWNKKLPKNLSNFSKVAQNISTAVRLKKWLFSKLPKSHQTFGLLLIENLLPRTSKKSPNLVTLDSVITEQSYCSFRRRQTKHILQPV